MHVSLELFSQLLGVLALEILHIDSDVGEHYALVDTACRFVDYEKDLSPLAVHFCRLVRSHLDKCLYLGVLHLIIFNILCTNTPQPRL